MQKFPLKTIFTSLALALYFAQAAGALTLPDQGEEENFAGASTTDGKSFVDQLRKTVAGFSDYSVDGAVYMYRPTAEHVGGGNICWKRVDLCRLTVKAKGWKDGSLVVRSADGKIKAAGGPSVRFLRMNLTEDSRLLQVPNGYNAIRSDFGTLLAKLNDQLNSGDVCKVTTQPVNVPRLKQNLYVLRVTKSGTDALSQEIYVNPANNVPLEWDLFKNGTRFSVATFENFKGNIGLDDSQFKI